MTSILIDSDFLISLIIQTEPKHSKAKQLFKKLSSNDDIFCLNLVLQETATVLSHKFSQTLAKTFYRNVKQILPKIIYLNQNLEKKTWKIFLSQTKKNISFIDCANLATKKTYKLDRIFSFDKFYPKNLRLN